MTPLRRLVLALVTALAPIGARAGVCDVRCAPDDLVCNATLALCDAKARAFDTYMKQLDTGRPKYPLPATVREILQPHYPGVDLAQVRFAFSDQQPPDNATTDCNQIYFSSESFVAALRDGTPSPKPKWKWLLHELVHPEQCAAAGGREGYAKRWWDELEAAVRESGETVNLFQSTEQLVKQLQALWLRVHDAMPMEREAETKAKSVLAELERCCLTEDGTLARATSSSR